MAFLVSETMERLRRTFGDMTPAVALEYINIVNRELHLMLRLKVDTEDVSLTAGTQEYALDADILRIEQAFEVTGAETNQQRALQEVDISHLQKLHPNWRRVGTGALRQFYTQRSASGYTLGLFPAPSQTTSSGYPVVRLHVVRAPLALASGSSFPEGILTPDVYYHGAAARYCMEHVETVAKHLPIFQGLYNQALQLEMQRVERLNPYDRRLTIPAGLPH